MHVRKYSVSGCRFCMCTTYYAYRVRNMLFSFLCLSGVGSVRSGQQNLRHTAAVMASSVASTRHQARLGGQPQDQPYDHLFSVLQSGSRSRNSSPTGLQKTAWGESIRALGSVSAPHHSEVGTGSGAGRLWLRDQGSFTQHSNISGLSRGSRL